MKKLSLSLLLSVVLIFIAIQFVPVDGQEVNPEIRAEPEWPSAEVRDLVVTACYDCHSNETVWPWYSNIAPFSWSITEHVREGREHLNFSEWDQDDATEHAYEAGEEVEEGKMPLTSYTLLHGDSRLSDEERELLVNTFNDMFGTEEPD